jgi:DNA-binding NtrC family response regulator
MHTARSASPSNGRDDEKPTVFVVDDDPATRELVGDILQEDGYAVELCADGPAFLAAYRAGRTGCLLVDALMPGARAVDFLEKPVSCDNLLASVRRALEHAQDIAQLLIDGALADAEICGDIFAMGSKSLPALMRALRSMQPQQPNPFAADV